MRDPQRRKRGAGSRRSLTLIIQALLIQNLSVLKAIGQTSECPPTESIPGCPCYNFQDGLFLECSGATEETLRSTLQAVLTASGKSVI